MSRRGVGVFAFWMMAASLALPARAQVDESRLVVDYKYEQGDWISFKDTRSVTCIAVGYRYIYAGTTQGVVRYHRFDLAYDYPYSTSTGMMDDAVRVLAFDRQTSFLWVVSKTAIGFYDPTSELWSNKALFDLPIGFDEAITSVGVSLNRVWFETNTGRFFESPSTAILLRKSEPPVDEAILWSGVRGITSGLPPLTTDDALYQFVAEDGTRFAPFIRDPDFEKYPVTYFVTDDWGDLWLGTDGLGLWKGRLDTRRIERLPYGLARSNVTALRFDGDDIWIGGLPAGSFYGDFETSPRNDGITLWRGDDSFDYFRAAFDVSIHSDRVRSIDLNERMVVFATDGGLLKYDRKNDNWTTYGVGDNLLSELVHKVVFEDDRLWIGTEDGLNFVDSKDDDFTIHRYEAEGLFGTAVYDIGLHGPWMWLTTEEGIFLLDPLFDSVSRFSALGTNVAGGANLLQPVRVVDFHASQAWFGSELGIVRYGTSSDMWNMEVLDPSFLKDGINDIYVDELYIWVATNQGLFRQNRSKRKWVLFTKKDGLASNIIHEIVPDGDYIWFATSAGLTEFHWKQDRLMID